jgi:hypothetical protein
MLSRKRPEGSSRKKAVLTDTDQSVLRRAFRSLRGELLPYGEPTERQLIEAAIRLVVKADRVSSEDKPGSLRSSGVEYVRTIDERIEDAKQRQVEFKAGDHPAIRFNLTAAEITAAEVIERVFKSLMTSRDDVRDWRVLFELARKEGDGLGVQAEYEGSTRNVGRKFNLTAKRIRAIRDRQLDVIVARTRHLMPEPSFTTGQILRAA